MACIECFDLLDLIRYLKSCRYSISGQYFFRQPGKYNINYGQVKHKNEPKQQKRKQQNSTHIGWRERTKFENKKISKVQQIQHGEREREGDEERHERKWAELLLIQSSFSGIPSLRIYSRMYEDPTVLINVASLSLYCHCHNILHLRRSWYVRDVDWTWMNTGGCAVTFYMKPKWWCNALYFLLCNTNLIGQFSM